MSRALRIALALAIASAAPIASGCGGSDGGSKPAKPEKSAAPPATTSAPDTTPEAGGGGGAGLTKPGTELSLGDTAQVTISSFATTDEKPPVYPLDATVLKIEKGTSADFKDIDLDAEQKAATPYYVTVRVKSTKETIPTEDNDPDDGFDGIDDRDQQQSSVVFVDSFPPCEDKDAPKQFKAGDSYKSCFVYLVPGGGSIEKVNWTGSGSSDYISDPVVWK